MKLTALFLILGMGVSVASNSYSQTTFLTIKAKNKTVKEIFKEIENNSEYMIFYYDEIVDANRKVEVNVKDQTVEKILDQLFAGTNNVYKIDGKQIYISKSAETQNVQQKDETREITGMVYDDINEPLPGANIVIQGSPRGVITDVDGSFSIKAKPTDKLVITFIGLTPQTINVGNQTNIIIHLKPLVSELKEVAVVAYGKQRKESVIGAITTVKVDDIRRPVGKVSTALAGQMAGVVAVQRSGEPGEGADFWIRGISTFGYNKNPLVLVDGIERSIDLVDVEDIATLSILKDATATAVYGVRGANGVVLITTRRGTEGKPKVNVRLECGILAPAKMPKMANAEQFLTMYNDVYRTKYNEDAPEWANYDKYINGTDPDLYPNVNWLDEIYKKSTTNQRINVNVSGGTSSVRYYVAGSFYNEGGIYNNQSSSHDINWRKFNFRSNIDINLHKSTVLSLYLSNQFETKNQPSSTISGGGHPGSLWDTSFRTIPTIIPTVYSDGMLAQPRDGENPYRLLNHNGYSNWFHNNAQSMIALDQDFSELITKGLRANVKFSWDAENANNRSWGEDPTYAYQNGRDAEGNLTYTARHEGNTWQSYGGASNSGSRTIYLEASATYERLFANMHRVGGLFLFNLKEYNNNFAYNFITAIPYRNMGIAGRVTYSYGDRYFMEANFGYNGSENFSPDKRFGFFPSVALGYLISNEKFWEPLIPVVNTFKLKGSYGLVGNDKISDDSERFAFNSEMNTSAASGVWSDTGTGIGGITTKKEGYPNVSWEEAKKLNIGLESEWFKSLRINVDYFKEERSGIFIKRESTPSVVGIKNNVWVNLGEMTNQGVDASVEYFKQFGEVLVSARGNFTYNRNKVLYDDKPTPVWAYRSAAGLPYRQQYGLVSLGYFQDQADIDNSPVQSGGAIRPGSLKYKDINGDGKIDTNDMIPMGRSVFPEINYGFGLSAQWKGFDAAIFFQGVGNVTTMLNGPVIWGFAVGPIDLANVYSDVADNRWREDDPNRNNAKYPRMDLDENQSNQQLSSAKLRNMRYMRLKNAEIGYTFPKNWMKKIKISSLRIYVQGENLVTFSPFKMWDPEIIKDPTHEWDNKNEGCQYPLSRVVNFGLSVSF